MNPARSLGPAWFGTGLGSLWIYCLGPMLGALLAVPVYRFLQGPLAGGTRREP
jgi:aquaporin Z